MRPGRYPTKSSLSSPRSSTSLPRLSSTEVSPFADRLMASRTGANGVDIDGRHQFIDYSPSPCLARGRRDVRVAIRILNQFRETTRACSSSDEVFEQALRRSTTGTSGFQITVRATHSWLWRPRVCLRRLLPRRGRRLPGVRLVGCASDASMKVKSSLAGVRGAGRGCGRGSV
jgi:hypothetical protein